MKKNIILSLLFCCFTCLHAQTGIDKVLQSIAENNKELKANEQLTKAQTAEARAENNLSDPSVNYSYLYGSPKELGKTGELTVTQGFDFPTLYFTRGKLNDIKSEVFDKQHEAFRRNLLLTAKNLCLDLILLNQEKGLLADRLSNAHALDSLYQKRLATGDANILEVNKIRLELMNTRTEADANTVARKNILQQLTALNGGKLIEFDDTDYTPVELPADFTSLKQEVLSADANLQALQSQQQAARQQIAVDKSGWLPKLEIGYRRNNGPDEKFNGFIVGGSIPLFENHGKVKAAKAQSLAAELQQSSAIEQAEATLVALYSEAGNLTTLMKSYDLALIDESLKLLRKALDARQISMIEYFTEVEAIYAGRQQYMQLQNRYQKVMAEIWKDKL